MAELGEFTKYDDVLTSILVNEKSILGFLSAIFNFLARRTDFYYVPDGPYENMGFPPGVAEELMLKVLRKCDPKGWTGTNKSIEINNEIMCSTVAQEVEVVAEEEESSQESLSNPPDSDAQPNELTQKSSDSPPDVDKSIFPEDYEPPYIPIQKNSESYNGAVREKYSWAQTISDLDVTLKLPPDIKTSKDLKVTINPLDVSVSYRNGNVIISDALPYKIKSIESFWSLSEGRLLMHLEKIQERWWNKFLVEEDPIDLSRIDCSRPLNDLPEDHVDKVRELQWNQEQKLKGLPTSDEIRNIEILKKAWNAAGSPFKGTKFDPNVLKK